MSARVHVGKGQEEKVLGALSGTTTYFKSLIAKPRSARQQTSVENKKFWSVKTLDEFFSCAFLALFLGRAVRLF